MTVILNLLVGLCIDVVLVLQFCYFCYIPVLYCRWFIFGLHSTAGNDVVESYVSGFRQFLTSSDNWNFCDLLSLRLNFELIGRQTVILWPSALDLWPVNCLRYSHVTVNEDSLNTRFEGQLWRILHLSIVKPRDLDR